MQRAWTNNPSPLSSRRKSLDKNLTATPTLTKRGKITYESLCVICVQYSTVQSVYSKAVDFGACAPGSRVLHFISQCRAQTTHSVWHLGTALWLQRSSDVQNRQLSWVLKTFFSRQKTSHNELDWINWFVDGDLVGSEMSVEFISIRLHHFPRPFTQTQHGPE